MAMVVMMMEDTDTAMVTQVTDTATITKMREKEENQLFSEIFRGSDEICEDNGCQG